MAYMHDPVSAGAFHSRMLCHGELTPFEPPAASLLWSLPLHFSASAWNLLEHEVLTIFDRSGTWVLVL